MKMSSDELEFLISQYVDGTLNPLEQRVVEERLAIDASARQVLSDYEKLNGELKAAMPMPAIAWDEFAANVQAKTALLDPPIRHYRLTFATMSKFASIAASILIAIGLVTKFMPGGIHSGIAKVNLSPVDVQLGGPASSSMAAAPGATAMANVSIGAAPNYAALDFHSAEAIITRPTSISISSGSPNGVDSDATPY